MKHIAAGLALAVTPLLASAIFLPDPYEAVDIKAALSRASADGKPIAIWVTSTGCGPCGRGRSMLASSTLSDHYLGAAHYVNLDALVPPDWYWKGVKSSGFDWINATPRRQLWSPGFIFLTNKGEYMCTMTGVFNNYTHALNIIKGIKAMNGVYKASSEHKICDGSTV